MKTLVFQGSVLKVGLTTALSMLTKDAYHYKTSPVKYMKIRRDKLPNQHYLKVRNIQTGICGSDMTLYTCKQGPSTAFLNVPGSNITYMGHETIGRVEEVGKDVDKFKVGDRVTLLRYLSCCANKDLPEPCEKCREGNYADCENYGVPSRLKQITGAGFGDYYYASQDQVIKVPDEITDDQAVLIEPFAVGLHSVLKCPPKDNDKVLVVGTGMIGLTCIQFAKVINPKCKVYVMGHGSKRNEFAKKLGADVILEGDPYEAVAKATGGKLYGKGSNRMILGGFDIIYDTVGKKNLFNDTLRWLKAQGTLVKVGYQMTKTKFDETPLWWQGLNVIGVDSHGMENYKGKKAFTFQMVMDMMVEGKLITDGFITHKFKLDDYKDAFRMIIEHRRDTIKVVLECQ